MRCEHSNNFLFYHWYIYSQVLIFITWNLERKKVSRDTDTDLEIQI